MLFRFHFAEKTVFTVGGRPKEAPTCKHGRKKQDRDKGILYNAAKEEQLKNITGELKVSLKSAIQGREKIIMRSFKL